MKRSAILVILIMLFAGQSMIVAEGNVPFDVSKDGTVKVMTFNIRVGAAFWDGGNRWGARKDIVVDTISDKSPDVFGLQEALDYQMEYIQQQLPQYGHYSVGRENGKDQGEACSIFYNKERYQLADQGTFWLSGNPEKAGSKNFGDVFPRICTWVKLTDKRERTSFYAYNVHMSLSQSSRMKAVKIISERIAQRGTNDPFVVMGDFNMKMDNSAMEYLCTKEGDNQEPMVNAWTCTKAGEEKLGTCSGFRGKVNGSKIDHIITNPQTKILDIEIDHNHLNGRYPSDHYPVVATLRFAETATAKAKAIPAVAAEKKVEKAKALDDAQSNLQEVINGMTTNSSSL
jgi:endonuclease/exonuclease/phosphatase family metal-dependent hydrolase